MNGGSGVRPSASQTARRICCQNHCMRGYDHQQADMYSYLSPEQRVRENHPLRKSRVMADEALNNMSARFNGM
jgi:hypothetical protein